MLLFLVEANQPSFFLGDSRNVNTFAFFTSGINDAVILSEINESEAVETKIARIEETDVFIVASLIQINQVLFVIVVEDNHTLEISCSESNDDYMYSMESLEAIWTLTLELRSLS